MRCADRSFHSFLAPQLIAYLDFKRKLGYTSYGGHCVRSTARDFDHYLIFRDLVAVGQIDVGLLHAWIHAVPERASGTKNKRLTFARGFFRYLDRLGLANENPALQITRLKPRHRKPHIYSLAELRQILDEAGKFKRRYPRRLMGWTLETMIFLIYACGLRLSEALNLRICDVDFDEGTLSLWKTKFHKERLVPFSPAAAEVLKAYLARRRRFYPRPAPTDRLFRSRTSSSYAPGTVEWLFRGILRRCGLAKPSGRGPRIHDLRHTFAVHRLYKWYQDGHDVQNKLPLLSTYMGHLAIYCTEVYLTIARDLLREGDRRFQGAFEPLAHDALARALGKL
jgi:integrase